MNMLLRRRLMMDEVGGSPTPPPAPVLLYKNTEPITTALTNTNVNILDPLISWTILVDATCNNYNWNTTSSYQGIFACSTNSKAFRFGKQNNAYSCNDGVVGSTKDNYYYALSMDASGVSNVKCITVGSRVNGSTRRKDAFRFNAATMKLEGVNHTNADLSKWFTVTGVQTNPGNVILLVGGISGATIHDIQIYSGLLTDQEMLDYVLN